MKQSKLFLTEIYMDIDNEEQRLSKMIEYVVSGIKLTNSIEAKRRLLNDLDIYYARKSTLEDLKARLRLNNDVEQLLGGGD